MKSSPVHGESRCGGSRAGPQLVQANGKVRAERGDPEMEEVALREMVIAPLPPPEEGREEIILFRSPFCQNLNTRAVSSISGFQEDTKRCGWAKPGSHSSSSVASTQQQAVRERYQRPYSCSLCPTVEPGKRCTTHSNPASVHPQKSSAQAGSLRSTSLPHCGYVGGSAGHACTVSGSLASTAQPISLGPSDHQTQLCDSVHPASPQVQGHPFHISEGSRCSCLACGDHSPTGERRDRSGPSSQYEGGVLQPLLQCTQERWWVTTNLGPACLVPGPSQATIQDVDAKTPLRMHLSPRLVCSDRPEGHVLSCLDPSVPQTLSVVHVQRTNLSVQGLTLLADLVPHVFMKVEKGGSCSPESARCLHPQLSWRLAHTSLGISCAITGTLCSGTSSQLGLQVNWEKSKLSLMQRISFLKMELDSVKQTAHLCQSFCFVMIYFGH